jgi:5'-methylthioadenosine phosphorylase
VRLIFWPFAFFVRVPIFVCMSELKIGLIGGSGLGDALEAGAGAVHHEVETPFGRPSGPILETQWDGLPILFLSRHGPGHLFNPSHVPFRANIFALKQLGCTHIIASGAVGSLREECKPRDLVVVDQVIDKTSRRAGTFFEKAAVHVDFAEPFCPVLRRILIEEGAGETTYRVHGRGCYVCMEGPAFSTRAESLMHRLWGGDLIGMTAMPEAKLAREAEIAYALVALVTDYDCWKRPITDVTAAPAAGAVDAGELMKEIIANLTAASDNAIALIRRAVGRLAAQQDALPASPAHDALRLGIWSDKSRVDPQEVERLAPLWGRYFKG